MQHAPHATPRPVADASTPARTEPALNAPPSRTHGRVVPWQIAVGLLSFLLLLVSLWMGLRA